MTNTFALALCVCMVVGCAASQPAAPPSAPSLTQELPTSISGRWRFPLDGTSQVFSLQQIAVQPDRTFTAKLTWWQTNSWCVARDVQIVGRWNAFGAIEFEVPRTCGVGYLVELSRSSSGWVGKASSGYGWGLSLDLKAD